MGSTPRKATLVLPVLVSVGLLVVITARGVRIVVGRGISIPGTGLTAAIILGVFWTLVWLWSSDCSPPGRGPVVPPRARAHFVVGIGTQCLHAFTVFYLAGRIERMSSTYGPLGIATVMMLWLFIVGRLIVGAAMLNATIHDRHRRGAALWPPWSPGRGFSAEQRQTRRLTASTRRSTSSSVVT